MLPEPFHVMTDKQQDDLLKSLNATYAVIAEHPPRDGRQWECQCARCGSSTYWVDCYNCEDGYSSHDCGEDCCCCLEPELNVKCDVCWGSGGWNMCISTASWCHMNPLKGRENIERGKLEWYTQESPDASK